MVERATLNALVRSLIDGTFRCLDAAAETINARYGRGASKGTLSKKLSGQLDWSVAEVVALEDACGRFPVTRWMARRLDRWGCLPAPMLAQAGAISREAGEAVAAILAAEQSAGADDRAQAVAEIDEAIEALRAARNQLEVKE